MKRRKYMFSHPLRRLCPNGKQRERVYTFSWRRVKMEKLAKIQGTCPMWVTIFFLLLSFPFFLSAYLVPAFNNTTVETQLSYPFPFTDYLFKDYSIQSNQMLVAKFSVLQLINDKNIVKLELRLQKFLLDNSSSKLISYVLLFLRAISSI